MHNEEHDPRHPHHWEHQRHRREEQHHKHHQHPENFNDFGSRWGEPAPRLTRDHSDWQPRNTDRFEEEGRYHREEDWLPEGQRRHQHPQRYQHHPQQHYHPMNQQQPHEPIWRQRDVHFAPSNQRVEDRWHEDPTMPYPQRRQPRHYDGFWQEYED
ncbi:hypothetical protein [Pontibacter oryzae]|uniref:Uncharacterized protein n=1 Tax=Pontibacter oryzae TaxID=2304593 RepID=A0A399S727_9BACT|nr:hypothetical protein [Pontibacter oryzae]RIJ37375.1 hypothetical protein D1627_09570 [Pontibacter oryzae]